MSMETPKRRVRRLRWRASSPKANLRKWERRLKVPLQQDTLAFERLLRWNPSLKLELQNLLEQDAKPNLQLPPPRATLSQRLSQMISLKGNPTAGDSLGSLGK